MYTSQETLLFILNSKLQVSQREGEGGWGVCESILYCIPWVILVLKKVYFSPSKMRDLYLFYWIEIYDFLTFQWERRGKGWGVDKSILYKIPQLLLILNKAYLAYHFSTSQKVCMHLLNGESKFFQIEKWMEFKSINSLLNVSIPLV